MNEKKMNSIMEYIFSPETLISIISTIIWVVIAFMSLKGRTESGEKDVRELQSQERHVKIAEMQKDIQYIREMFDRFLDGKK